MKAIIRRAHREVYEQELEAFIFGHPAQVALLGLQFQWTAEMQVRRGLGGTPKSWWQHDGRCREGQLGQGAVHSAWPHVAVAAAHAAAVLTAGRCAAHPCPGRAARRQERQGRDGAGGQEGGGRPAAAGGADAAPRPVPHPAHQPGDVHHRAHAPEGGAAGVAAATAREGALPGGQASAIARTECCHAAARARKGALPGRRPRRLCNAGQVCPLATVQTPCRRGSASPSLPPRRPARTWCARRCATPPTLSG